MHDIGKVGIPSGIFHASTELNDEEFVLGVRGDALIGSYEKEE